MSVERSVHLDLSAGSADARTRGQGPPADRRGEPDPRAREEFERLLSGPPKEAHADGSAVVHPGPFALLARHAARAAEARPGGGPELSQALESLASRLMVGEGQGGGKQVRLELGEDVVPGVTVVVEQVQGRLQVDFICSQESTRLALAAHIRDSAGVLATRLGCGVLLRVLSDHPGDPCLAEVLSFP